MVKRISITDFKKIVAGREHELLDFQIGRVDPTSIPQSSEVKLKCNHKNCGNVWSARLQAYLDSETSVSKGCRKCFEKNLKDRNIYENTPFAPRADIVDRPHRRRGKDALRETHKNGPYGHIQNRKQLIKFLEQNPNEHNDYALKLVLRDTQSPKRKSELPKGEYSFHHVIPLHAKGSPDSWNLIYVTKQEHDQIHRLRYQVYQDRYDLIATNATLSDLEMTLNLSPPTEQQSFEERESIKVENRRNALLGRRNPETLKALNEGMIWFHKKTGVKLIIQPNSVETIKEVRKLLIECLPHDNDERQRMVSNESSSHTYIRDHITTVFKIEGSTTVLKKSRFSVYGFTVQSLNAGESKNAS